MHTRTRRSTALIPIMGMFISGVISEHKNFQYGSTPHPRTPSLSEKTTRNHVHYENNHKPKNNNK
jgi:hypothetical protein